LIEQFLPWASFTLESSVVMTDLWTSLLKIRIKYSLLRRFCLMRIVPLIDWSWNLRWRLCFKHSAASFARIASSSISRRVFCLDFAFSIEEYPLWKVWSQLFWDTWKEGFGWSFCFYRIIKLKLVNRKLLKRLRLMKCLYKYINLPLGTF